MDCKGKNTPGAPGLRDIGRIILEEKYFDLKGYRRIHPWLWAPYEITSKSMACRALKFQEKSLCKSRNLISGCDGSGSDEIRT